jgi:hypothetical protein
MGGTGVTEKKAGISVRVAKKCRIMAKTPEKRDQNSVLQVVKCGSMIFQLINHVLKE